MATLYDNRVDIFINNYTQLETQLLECLDYMPFIVENKNVISPKFIPIIVESCALIESIFKQNINKDQKKYSFKKYSEFYEPILSLSGVFSIFLESPLQILNPFNNWDTQQPNWWEAYNLLKHDRLNNYKSATITNALLALSGLHQQMSKFKNFIGGFLKAGWIDTTDTDLIADISSVSHLAGLHPSPPSMIIESKLFVSPTRENFVTYIKKDDPCIFDIDFDFRGLSNRVRTIIYAHQDWSNYYQ